MLIEKYVTVEGKAYRVTLSDDSEALQAAYAAGGAIIGIWSPEEDAEAGKTGGSGGTRREAETAPKRNTDFTNCLYLTDDPEEAAPSLLEKAVRRRLGLPLIIAETKRLIIREFQASDPLEDGAAESPDGCGNRVFCSHALRDAYIAGQYRFCECGLWALEEKQSGSLVGKAGITDGELGYHIYRPYRRLGYAREACRKICEYAAEEMELEILRLKTDRRNRPSIRLAERLGFVRIKQSEFSPAEAAGLLFYEKRLAKRQNHFKEI